VAVILDAFSRKVIGWELDRTLAARLPLASLEKAIAERKPAPGVVHHSDRGVQYASGAYVAMLRKHGMIPSMSRPANPYDNASCESFVKTLKEKKFTPTNTAIWNICERTSRSSSTATTTACGSIPRWAIGRRRNLNGTVILHDHHKARR